MKVFCLTKNPSSSAFFFHEALFILQYKVWKPPFFLAKATEQYFQAALFIMLGKAILTLFDNSVKWDKKIETILRYIHVKLFGFRYFAKPIFVFYDSWTSYLDMNFALTYFHSSISILRNWVNKPF